MVLLIEHAVRIIAWQRSEQVRHAAEVQAANLEIALQSSRRIGAAIGILMCQHKVTEPQAFALLKVASQHSHRKVHDLAVDVIDTGSLDPALLRTQPPPRTEQLGNVPSRTGQRQRSEGAVMCGRRHPRENSHG